MPKNTDKRQKSGTKAARDQKILALAMEGKRTTTEIAAEVGVERHTVSKVLNSPDAKELIDEAKGRLRGMLSDCIDAVQDAVTQRGDLSTSARTALAVLKSEGVVVDKSELTHSFPKPTVIRRLDGSSVTLGATHDDADSDE